MLQLAGITMAKQNRPRSFLVGVSAYYATFRLTYGEEGKWQLPALLFISLTRSIIRDRLSRRELHMFKIARYSLGSWQYFF